MDLGELIADLRRPGAYDPPAWNVVVVQTHISVVFLAEDRVYKVKKPVDLGFLDFTTLERRAHFCREEVRLNRRLAPDVYLGVAPIVRRGERATFGDPLDVDDGEPPAIDAVDWAVVMRRLPAESTLERWVEEGHVGPYHVAVLGRRIARFHAAADSGAEIAAWGRFEVVAGNARENLEQARPHVAGEAGGPGGLTERLLERLHRALERRLAALEPLIDKRARAGVPCDTHGDLHLDHVYLFADRDPPRDIVIIDCVEFNERFRFADPVSDIAFLDMDLRYHGRADLTTPLVDAYFDAADDEEGRRLLSFYSAYRAAVRAKVSGMRAVEPEVPPEERARSIESARAHWLLALGLLEPPARRPALVLIGGLPGTGKSTLASSLGERAGFEVLSSDRTRKRLAGIDPATPAAAEFGAGLYTGEWNDRTYAALLETALDGLLDGERVIVDASFREDGRRDAFLAAAADLCVPAVFLRLEAPPRRVRRRIEERGDTPSDADVDIYEAVAARWEPATAGTAPHTRVVDTGQSPAWSVEQSLAHLADLGVWWG
ncbi:MAG: AAA family ATPase [Gemmatimonadota bacterium]|nr:AAA family ATPase [Gemmatimonadota bacterium]